MVYLTPLKLILLSLIAIENIQVSSSYCEPIKEGVYFIRNRKYPHARLAQWGYSSRSVGTYENWINKDQLWVIKESRYSSYCGRTISNLEHTGYRLAKWSRGDRDTGVYNGQYYSDQTWLFYPSSNGYYYISNYKYKNCRLGKWGKSDGDFGSYCGGYYNDQEWELIPRFQMKITPVIVDQYTNYGKDPITLKLKYKTGTVKKNGGKWSTTKEITLASKQSIEMSLGIPLAPELDAGLNLGAEFSQTIKNTINQESSWENTETKAKENSFDKTVKPGQSFKIYQTKVSFTSDLSQDNYDLYLPVTKFY